MIEFYNLNTHPIDGPKIDKLVINDNTVNRIVYFVLQSALHNAIMEWKCNLYNSNFKYIKMNCKVYEAVIAHYGRAFENILGLEIVIGNEISIMSNASFYLFNKKYIAHINEEFIADIKNLISVECKNHKVENLKEEITNIFFPNSQNNNNNV